MGKKRDVKHKNGFTLIEVLIVIGILSVMSLIVLPRLIEVADMARERVDEANALSLFKEVQMAYMIGSLTGNTNSEVDITSTLPDVDIIVPDPLSSTSDFIITAQRVSQNPSIYNIHVSLDGDVMANGRAEAIVE